MLQVQMNVIKIIGSFEDIHFWNALKIYYKQPKSINREVLFSENIFVVDFQFPLTLRKCQEVVDCFDSKLSTEWCFLDDFRKTCGLLGCNVLDVKNVNDGNGCEEVEKIFLLPNKTHLFVRKLIPKINVNEEFEFIEFIFLDKINTVAYIFTKYISKTIHQASDTKKQDPLTILKFNFLKLTFCKEYVEVCYDKNLGEKGLAWLNATFVSKFKKLLINFDKCNKNSNKLQFNCQVDIVQYYKYYEELKVKYGKYFVENWTENTDPKKFVYEDIGIATYLLMLWNGGIIPGEDSKKQKFIDLGCGNGLLVHILNSEGHSGIGLDMRKRKIWDTYPPTTVLEEKVINPTEKTIFPEADWLIGNHSDELTAWIPIMSRLSNNHCQYFVLPCCPYQLNGTKFQRRNSGLSSYQDFINYVVQVSKSCGFETYVDKLRIPSTKRICLVGFNKPEILEERYSLLKDEIVKFIEQECQCVGDEKSDNKIPLNFKIRESVEPVRNCTKLPQEFIDNVLNSVMSELLKSKNITSVVQNGKPLTWNRGGKLPIGQLASCLNKDTLKQLKSECKGLQTLLKNHHFLFEVSQGFVQFRSPGSMEKLCNKFLETQNETKWKLKKCWFFHNHPDKCPLSDNVCSYNHN